MTKNVISINMDTPCTKCGRKGTTQGGLCIECVKTTLIKKLKSDRGKNIMTTATLEKQTINGIKDDEQSQEKLLSDLVTILDENIPEAVEAVYKTAEKAILTIKITIAPEKDSSTSHTFEIKPTLNKPRIIIKRNASIENENGIFQMALFEEC